MKTSLVASIPMHGDRARLSVILTKDGGLTLAVSIQRAGAWTTCAGLDLDAKGLAVLRAALAQPASAAPAPYDQGVMDQCAHEAWEDGLGATCATTSGVWHAALAWERARVARLTATNATN